VKGPENARQKLQGNHVGSGASVKVKFLKTHKTKKPEGGVSITAEKGGGNRGFKKTQPRLQEEKLSEKPVAGLNDSSCGSQRVWGSQGGEDDKAKLGKSRRNGTPPIDSWDEWKVLGVVRVLGIPKISSGKNERREFKLISWVLGGVHPGKRAHKKRGRESGGLINKGTGRKGSLGSAARDRES